MQRNGTKNGNGEKREMAGRYNMKTVISIITRGRDPDPDKKVRVSVAVSKGYNIDDKDIGRIKKEISELSKWIFRKMKEE